MTNDSPSDTKLQEIEFRILGLDPGFAHLGLALLVHTIRFDWTARTQLEDVMHIHTKKLAGNGVSQKQDDRRRLGEITTTVLEQINDFQPHIIAFEDYPFVRNARSSVQIALAWGGCFTLARHVQNAAVLVYDPDEVKVAACGNPTAEKIEVIRAIDAKFPEANICEHERLGTDAYVNEVSHGADAVGAGLAASASGKVRLAVGEWRRRAGLDDGALRKVIATAEKPVRRW